MSIQFCCSTKIHFLVKGMKTINFITNWFIINSCSSKLCLSNSNCKLTKYSSVWNLNYKGLNIEKVTNCSNLFLKLSGCPLDVTLFLHHFLFTVKNWSTPKWDYVKRFWRNPRKNVFDEIHQKLVYLGISSCTRMPAIPLNWWWYWL